MRKTLVRPTFDTEEFKLIMSGPKTWEVGNQTPNK